MRAGTEGTFLAYDRLSRRTSASYQYNGGQVYEDYGYSQDGYLETVKQSGVLKAVRVLDKDGRTVQYLDKQNSTQTVTTYDKDNRTLKEVYTDSVKPKNNATTDYSYYGDTADTTSSQTGAGQLARTVNTPTGDANATVITTTYAYEYWDSAQQSRVVKTAVNQSAPNWYPGETRLYYNANGHLRQNWDVAGNVTTNYLNNGAGLIMRRERTQGSNVNIGRHYYYYVNGQRVGDVSDDPSDNTRVSYAEALAHKRDKPQDVRTLYKTFKPVTSADFDQNYEPINESYPGAVPGSYTVHEGDSLQSIARNVWGDSSLWYLIADANGLSGSEVLQAGRVLSIPNKVTNIHNNSTTFRPYDAGEAIGRIDPTLPPAPPPPHHHHGCGIIGQIIAIVVTAVVAYYTGGALANVVGKVAGYAIGAAAGSIAGQGVSIAVGNQSGFSWKAVGQAAIGGAITGGLAQLATATQGVEALDFLRSSSEWAGAGRAALSTGINEVLHGDWDWGTVLTAAVGAGVTTAVGAQLEGTEFGQDIGNFGRNLVSSFAGGASAALVSGNRRYDSVFVSTLGSVIGSSLTAPAETQGRGPWSEADYRNGSDVESDNATADRLGREAMYGVASAPAARDVRLGDQGAYPGAEWSASVDRGIAASVNGMSGSSHRLLVAAGNGFDWDAALGGGFAFAQEPLPAGPIRDRFSEKVANATSDFGEASKGVFKALTTRPMEALLKASALSAAVDPQLVMAEGFGLVAAGTSESLQNAAGGLRVPGAQYSNSVQQDAGDLTDAALLLSGGYGLTRGALMGLGGAGLRIETKLGTGAQAVPLGFSRQSEFVAFGDSLYAGLEGAGFKNVQAGFQGSSVTGRAYKAPNLPFDVGRLSDYDIAVSSPELFGQAQAIGMGLRQQGIRTGPLLPEHLDRLGLTGLSNQLSLEAGRPVKFMIYRSIDDATSRSPTIPVPRRQP